MSHCCFRWIQTLGLGALDLIHLILFRDWKADGEINQEISQYGDAPVRHEPTGPDKQRYTSQEPSSNPSHHHHRLHFPGHRHTRSREEGPKPPSKDVINGQPVRPLKLRQESSTSIQPLKASMASPKASRANLPMRGTSPTPSLNNSLLHRDTAGSEKSSHADNNSGKRSLFDKIRRHKGDKVPHESLSHLLGSTFSLHDSGHEKHEKGEFSPSKNIREGSVATFDSGSTAKASDYHDSESPISKKESAGSRLLHSHGKFPKPKRGNSYERDSGDTKTRNGSVVSDPMFLLDTNLDDMEGIVKSKVHPPDAPHGGIFTGDSIEEEPRKESHDMNMTSEDAAWDAPDSWAVNRAGDENVARLPEIDETGVPSKDNDPTQYCIRVFRIDSTFATVATGINTTVSEVLQILGKKSFLQDELNNYQIIMRKQGLQKQLLPGERPVAIQKRLLEQAGYQSNDRIEEIGREDNSYLCRFTFVPTKLSGFYSLEREPGLAKMQKFSHVDLQGRSLVTIPITLYQKATEIVSLNLSRNLSLDIPKDFITGCTNLREIKYISNEAWQLPQSLSLATRLTVLDISNNRLEQLDHANLDRLQNLTSLKLSNNKLKVLPAYVGKFQQLRSLNLSSNYMEKFPDSLCTLKSLVDLDVSFNAIKELPNIGQLSTLERFWATNNRLTGAFTHQFQDLHNLKEIDLRFNGITSIDGLSGLPKLEQLMVGHNAISKFEGSFAKMRILFIDHNPVTTFDLRSPSRGLTSLNLASSSIASLKDTLFENLPNLTKLNLDKNHLTNLPKEIGRLRKLELLSIAKNPLESLPNTIGQLENLHFLDARECNLRVLPAEIWNCFRLDTLNVSSNILESFPKPNLQSNHLEKTQSNASTASNSVVATPAAEEGNADDFVSARKPSTAAGGLLSVGSTPGAKKGSIVSIYGPGGRKASVFSRTTSEGTITPITRKDTATIQDRLVNTFATSLRNLYMADNRLEDTVFDDIVHLPNLRVLNLSYNELLEIPLGSLQRWQYLNELYLSGNEMSSLPSDDLEHVGSLKILHLNGNKYQVLPAELAKAHKLAVLDVGSNSLKYNVSNYPYDYNWNYNKTLKYLNFSGNKRLEIKGNRNNFGAIYREGVELTSFNSLQNLRVLGLMDVTLTIPSVPDQTEDRRVRTSSSLHGTMTYGMADTLGKHEHLSILDMVVPKFRGHETETVLGMFDGQASSSGGSKLAKYLHDNFQYHFAEELRVLKPDSETPSDALRRTFLALNKDLATAANQSFDEKENRAPQLAHRNSIAMQTLNPDDLNSGGVATVAFLDNMELYLANVGDAQAMLIQSDGTEKTLTRKHEPERERERIRQAGGYVSRHGKLNDVLEVSRAFGYIQLMPAVMAAPNVARITLTEQDEMILIASRELWEYLTPDVVVDLARSERTDLMRAAQKLRDMAMAYGATGKIMVMMIGVSDLKKRERNRFRGTSLSMGPNQMQNEEMFPTKGRRGFSRREGDRPDDSRLQRLDPEVEAPQGQVSIVFTDIKNSTSLWEAGQDAMQSAIKIHNDIMRRQLRLIGGYEVKTEGDAFMVSFKTATAALLWCFSVQSHLLDAPWPQSILDSPHCAEASDLDGNTIFRGLSVRMGIHYGSPVCERDPVTRRMDYFGPMVNRAARISGVADGGQINVSSDFIAEIHRMLETYADSDRAGSTGSSESGDDDALAESVRKDLRALSTQGFEVKDLGTLRLKGLENPEYVYMMYPHSLAGRLLARQQEEEAEAAKKALGSNETGNKCPDSKLDLQTPELWALWEVSLRLEMLCSALEDIESTGIRKPETSNLERIKNNGGEVSDDVLMGILDHQISRIEVYYPNFSVLDRAVLTWFDLDKYHDIEFTKYGGAVPGRT